MRVLVSPTAFKGTLSPGQASRLITSTIKSQYPKWKITVCPVADGGDGTLEVLAAALKAKKKKTKVFDPLGKPVRAPWAMTGQTAIIEMARASGLALVKNKNRIMDATTYGTGQLIRAALNHGCRKIVIGVGGAATGDGGAGALRALGLKYKDGRGKSLSGSPSELSKIKTVEWEKLDPRLRQTNVFVVCDVTNPLLGPNGSARTFGPQKGATKKQVVEIERGLRHWSTFAKVQTKNSPGAGSAGALAYGLSGFLGAKLVAGSPFVFKILKWRKKARKADVIVTGEGQLDATSFSGKPVGEIVKNKGRARLFVICGRMRLSQQKLRRKGIEGPVEMGSQGLTSPEPSIKAATKEVLLKFASITRAK